MTLAQEDAKARAGEEGENRKKKGRGREKKESDYLWVEGY